MKKYGYQFVCLCFLVFGSFISSCQNNNNKNMQFALEIMKQKQKEKEQSKIVVTSGGKEYTSYRAACNDGNFDAAREFVEVMKSKTTEVIGTDDRKALDKQIAEAEDYVFKAEMNYLASLNDEKANARIILLINEMQTEGVPRPEGTCVGKNCYVSSRWGRDGDDDGYKDYIDWVSQYNLMLDKILDISIATGNESLAKRLLHLFRQDATTIYKPAAGRNKDDDYKDVYAHYTNDSKNTAQKKYQEAVRSGAFK